MNITDLTPQQLRQAASIKEKLDALNRELRSLLDGSSSHRANSGNKRTLSAAVRKKIAAAQRAMMGEGGARLTVKQSGDHPHCLLILADCVTSPCHLHHVR
jgi:hypothetical protein